MPAVNLGTFAEGEIPLDFEWQYKNFDGSAIDLSGYSPPTFRFWDPYHTEASVAGTISNASEGRVTVTRTAAMSAMTGPWRAQFETPNGTYNLVSHLLLWTIR